MSELSVSDLPVNGAPLGAPVGTPRPTVYIETYGCQMNVADSELMYGKLIASGGADKQLRVSDVKSGKLLKTFEGHTHHVMGTSWRADGRVLASSGADNAIKVWDWIKGERRKNLDGWDKEVTSVHYLGTSTRLATTSGDKQVRLIGDDAATPVALPGTTDFMDSSAVSQSGDRVAAGGEDSVLRVWDTKTAKEIASFAKPQSETAAK